MNTAFGDSVKPPKSHSAPKSEQRAPLQARLSAADAREEEERAASILPPDETPAKAAPKAEEALGKDVRPPFERPALDVPEGTVGSLASPGLAQELRDVAESLSRVADALENLDLFMHKGRPSENRPTLPGSTLGQLAKSRPELQQLLRDYLFGERGRP
ncbi:MAG: hypothetical protein OWU84_06555 [Firmicutes bacterium]|nr:hypothetical protein [Bacillota bacterium]